MRCLSAYLQYKVGKSCLFGNFFVRLNESHVHATQNPLATIFSNTNVDSIRKRCTFCLETFVAVSLHYGPNRPQVAQESYVAEWFKATWKFHTLSAKKDQVIGMPTCALNTD